MFKHFIKRVINFLLGSGPYKTLTFDQLYTDHAYSPSNTAEKRAYKILLVQGSIHSYSKFKPIVKAQFFSSRNSNYIVLKEREKERFLNGGFFFDPDKSIYTLFEGCVFTNRGIIYDAERRAAIEESAHDWFLPLSRSPLFGALRLKKAVYIDATVFSICSAGSESGYYHFLHESLPRLWLVKDFIDKIDFILVPAYELAWKRKILDVCGIDSHKIIWLQPDSHYQFKQIMFSNLPINDHQPSLWSCNAIRQLLNFQIPKEEASGIIWISRKKTAPRSIVWEDKISLLYPEIEFVDFAEESHEEMLKICGNAKIIMGPHGAGFSNLVFCKPGTKVLEIFPDNVWHALYHRISDINKLDHYILHLNFENSDDMEFGMSAFDKAITSLMAAN